MRSDSDSEGSLFLLARLVRRSRGKSHSKKLSRIWWSVGSSLVVAFWWLAQGSGSPLTKAVGRLMPRFGEGGVAFFISLLGPRSYEAYLQQVVPILVLVAILLTLLLAKALEFQRTFVLHPDEVLFFEDRIEWLAGEERLVLDADPAREERAGEATAGGKRPRPGRRSRRSDSVWASWRYFRHPSGRVAVVPLSEPGWQLLGPKGEHVRKAPSLALRHMVEHGFGLPAFVRFLSKRLALACGVWIVFFGLLLAIGGAGPHPWTSLLWAMLRTEGLGISASAELAKDSRYLKSLYLYLATIAAGDDPSATLDEYRDVLVSYLSSGGENYWMRAEAAVQLLGAGRPNVGLSLLAPVEGSSGLEARLAWAAGDHERARQVLQREKGEKSPGGLLALLEMLDGSSQAARGRLVREEPETAQAAIIHAVLWSILGEPEQALQLLESPLVGEWLEAQESQRGSARSQTIFFAYREIRSLASSALAVAVVDPPAGEVLWRRAETLALAVDLTHALKLDRRLWELCVSACQRAQAPRGQGVPPEDPDAEGEFATGGLR